MKRRTETVLAAILTIPTALGILMAISGLAQNEIIPATADDGFLDFIRSTPESGTTGIAVGTLLTVLAGGLGIFLTQHQLHKHRRGD